MASLNPNYLPKPHSKHHQTEAVTLCPCTSSLLFCSLSWLLTPSPKHWRKQRKRADVLLHDTNEPLVYKVKMQCFGLFLVPRLLSPHPACILVTQTPSLAVSSRAVHPQWHLSTSSQHCSGLHQHFFLFLLLRFLGSFYFSLSFFRYLTKLSRITNVRTYAYKAY